MTLGRSVFGNALVYSGAGILEKLVSFALLPIYAHIFETEGFGVIGMIDAAVGLLVIAFASGFHTAIIRTYHEEPTARQPRVISTAVMLMWLLGLLVVPIPILASPWLAALLLGDADYSILIVLSLITLVVDVGGKSASTYLIIQQRSVLYSLINLLRMILGVALNVWLVLVLRIGLIGIFISSLAIAAVTAIIYVAIAVRNSGLTFDRQIARRLCGFQLPMVPAEILAFISRYAEQFIVRFSSGLGAVGVLEMAYKFPPMLNMFIVAPFMLAWRTKSVEIADDASAPRVMGRMLTAFVFVLTLCALVLAVNIGPVLVLLTPPEFWFAATVAKIDIVTTVLTGLATFMQFGYLFHRRTTQLAIAKSTLSIVKIGVSVLLITQWGLQGAAYSALLIQAATLVWIWRQSQGFYRIEVEASRIAAIGAGAVGLYILITYIDAMPVGPVAMVAGSIVSFVTDPLRDGLLGQWNSVVAVLSGKERALAEIIVNTLIALTLLAVLPFMYPTSSLRQTSGLLRRKSAVEASV